MTRKYRNDKQPDKHGMNNVLRHKTSNVTVEIVAFPADTKYAVILHEANAVAGVIEFRRRTIETVEHEERIRKLEERHPGENQY